MERTEIIGALGPTNTGKTHRAIERMLDHDSGMMGLPLRLLAREVYEKVVARVGAEEVALITGEEKRIPRTARYFVCTVEAMPIEREVDFLAVDEIQLAGHRERGHVFTDRLLHARGTKETWFMGSETMAPLVQQLVPTIQLRRHPRLSSLSGEGSFSLGSLPRRSAVVAFSAKRVYELAEKLRARKGGAAIVLGGLSPRARNAQVEMYQAGEVDYLVATDAIGMGLNLDIDRVAFSDVRKFDGREWRDLELGELAQIAGRAGRYTKDGAFGTFGREALPRDLERAIENHRFAPQRRLVWRRSDLDFSSAAALIDSLEEQPKNRALELVGDPEDTRTLKNLLRREEVLQRITSEGELRLLWELCQIPDYRQLLVDEHAHLVGEIFELIVSRGRVPAEFVQGRLHRLAQHTGDIDTITARISFTRTWNYVANHEQWVEQAGELQERTRQLEDELSDALHQALLERFVARRKTAAFGRCDLSEKGGDKQDFSARLRALHAELVGTEPARSPVVEALGAEHTEIELSLDGRLSFQGTGLGLIRAGRAPLEPEVRPSDEHNASGMEERLGNHLRAWVREEIRRALGPLAKGGLPEDSHALRGVLYQLRAGWGAAPRHDLNPLLANLGDEERAALAVAGIVVGRKWIYVLDLLGPDAIRRRAPFVRVHLTRTAAGRGLASLLDFASPLKDSELAGAPLLAAGPLRAPVWRMLGYGQFGAFAVRIDLLEELSISGATLKREEFELEIVRVLSCGAEQARELTPLLHPRRKRRRRRKGAAGRREGEGG